MFVGSKKEVEAIDSDSSEFQEKQPIKFEKSNVVVEENRIQDQMKDLLEDDYSSIRIQDPG